MIAVGGDGLEVTPTIIVVDELFGSELIEWLEGEKGVRWSYHAHGLYNKRVSRHEPGTFGSLKPTVYTKWDGEYSSDYSSGDILL